MTGGTARTDELETSGFRTVRKLGQGASAVAYEAEELATHRPQLLKYAMLQLRNTAQAEDAVQETLVAAIRGAATFSGGSSVRTWLVGILKHKIIDSIRKSSREQSLDQYEASADDMDAFFQPDGHYVDKPADWGDPERDYRNAGSSKSWSSAWKACPG